MGLIPKGCWYSLQPLCHLSGTKPVSALTHVLLYCCTDFFFISSKVVLLCQLLTWKSDFQSSTVLEHLESGQGQGLKHMRWLGAWAWLQLLYSSWAKVTKKAWPLVFLELLKTLEKQWPKLKVFLPAFPSLPKRDPVEIHNLLKLLGFNFPAFYTHTNILYFVMRS